MEGLQIQAKHYKKEGLSIISVYKPYLQRQKISKTLNKSNMKFPVALLGVVLSTIFVQAITLPRQGAKGTGLMSIPCPPGYFLCAASGFRRCGNPSIVRIPIHNRILLTILYTLIL